MSQENYIYTKRLVLRPFKSTDLESFYEYAADKDEIKYMRFLPLESMEECEKFLEAVEEEWKKKPPRAYEYAITLEGVNIGEISVYNEEGKGELGWILNKKYQGKGYAFEAATALIEYAKENLGFNEFFACCDCENTASSRLIEKLGMHLVCTKDGRKNKYSDHISKSLVYEL